MASENADLRSPRIAVSGVSGYVGAELVRLLLGHPRLNAESLLLCSRPGDRVAVALDELHPELSGLFPKMPVVEPFSWERVTAFGADLLLLATPHELSRAWVPEALRRGLRVVDLSGAWRLQVASNRAVYGLVDDDPVYADDIQQNAVFGAPELHREAIATARLVANPGCYATSIILALAPLLRAGVVDLERGILADSKSGASGAGKAATAKTHFMHVADNLSAYNVFEHRHTGELLEQLELTADQLQFTPHLLPIQRGILSTIYLRLRQTTEAAAADELFRTFYKTCPMVRVRDPGVLPQIQHVVRTSFCDLGFALHRDGRRMVLVSCLDNLLKGAAGQAVQNMNLMLGWAEAEGLR